jgi:hypothetical protein
LVLVLQERMADGLIIEQLLQHIMKQHTWITLYQPSNTRQMFFWQATSNQQQCNIHKKTLHMQSKGLCSH